MTNPFWRALIAGRKRRPASPTTARLRCESLEELIVPAYTVSSLAVTDTKGAAVTSITENSAIRLDGKYTATSSIGGLTLLIDWGDGTTSAKALTQYGTNIAFPQQTHGYLDDVGPGPVNGFNITVTVKDTGLTSIGTGGTSLYAAADIPWIDIDLLHSPALDISQAMGSVNDQVSTIDLNGNSFHFYGADYQRVTVSDNGLIYLGQPANIQPTNFSLGGSFDLIAPLATDLRLDNAVNPGSILYRFVDIDGNGIDDYLVIEWNATHNNAGNDTCQFQALLQLNTSGPLSTGIDISTQRPDANGDIIFNYRDTDFLTSTPTGTFDFGAGGAEGLQRPTNNGGSKDGVTGSATLPGGRYEYTGNHQAIRFTSQTPTPSGSLGISDNFGYSAYRAPFELRANLQRFTNTSVISPVFDDSTGVVSFGVGNTFTFYGTAFGSANASSNGLLTFNGSDSTSNNTQWPNVPTFKAIAALWDNWASDTTSPTTSDVSAVLSRLVNFDGDGQSDFCIVEWSEVYNVGLGTLPPDSKTINVNPATFQAILQLNTGAQSGPIYLNYADTDVNPATFGKTASTTWDNGAKATVGIKDTGTANVVTVRNNSGNASDDLLEDRRAVLFVPLDQGSANASINVVNVVPSFSITGDGQTIAEGSVLTAGLVITDIGSLDTFKYNVNWGDGVIQSFANVDRKSAAIQHQYADNGKYTVTVTGFFDKDDNDASGTALPDQSISVTVTNVAPRLLPIQNRAIQASTGLLDIQDLPANFLLDPGYSFTPAKTVENFTVLVDWGDGKNNTLTFTPASQPRNDNNNTPATQITFPLTHKYATTGQVTVTLTATDDDGGVGTTAFIVRVGSPTATAVAADAGAAPTVQITDSLFGTPLYTFDAYDSSFRGGVRVAVGDVNGDNLADYVTAPGKSGGPHIRVFSGYNGAEIASFYAYSPTFYGGVFVAVGDVNGDGYADIITGAGATGGPHVKVFSGFDVIRGITDNPIRSFYAFSPQFYGGVQVGAGKIDADNLADIVVAAGPGGGPHVRAFSGADNHELMSFFAYDPSFTGGVNLAVGDTNNDGFADIVTGPGLTGGPDVHVYSGKTGAMLYQFYGFPPGSPGGNPYTGDDVWASGIRVALTDVGDPFGTGPDADGDGFLDIVVGPGAGRTARTRVYDGKTRTLRSGDLLHFGTPFLGGIYLGGN